MVADEGDNLTEKALTKLFEVVVSLPEDIIGHVEAEDEDEARIKAEDIILRAMERGEFEVEVEELGNYPNPFWRFMAQSETCPRHPVKVKAVHIVYESDSGSELEVVTRVGGREVLGIAGWTVKEIKIVETGSLCDTCNNDDCQSILCLALEGTKAIVIVTECEFYIPNLFGGI